MPAHDLIQTLAIGLAAALFGGFVARRLGLSPIVGYLLAGVAVGPHAPGFVANAEVAAELAELGIVLLMFGVGLDFSPRDLWAVRRVAVPSAVLQSGVATCLGLLVGLACGWPIGSSLIFGMALSVASTVLVVRSLSERDELRSAAGRLAVGWLVVEDLLAVFLLVLLPALAATGEVDIGRSLLLTTGKFAVLGVVVYSGGSWLVPRLLAQVARLQSRELFTLAVLTVAIGIAWGTSTVFGVSMALGAFLGGMVVGQSDLSHQAAADALPMRDAFAVLFFVSVGMLFDPAFAIAEPGLLLASLAIVLIGKPLVAITLVLGHGHSLRSAFTVGAGMAQIGEFSFILAALGRSLGVMPAAAHSCLLAVAVVSIAVNPLARRAAALLERWLQTRPRVARWVANKQVAMPALEGTEPRGHAVLCGHGRVGGLLANVLRQRNWPYVVIDQDRAIVEELRRRNVPALYGDAGNALLLERAHVERARVLLLCTPDPLTARLAAAHARRLNPAIHIVARVHADTEAEYLRSLGRAEGVHGELELALEMTRLMLQRFGVSAIESQATILDLRRARGNAADVRGMTVNEVAVPTDSPAHTRRLADLGLGQGVLIVAIGRGGEFVVPSGQTTLAAGDILLVLADADGLRRLETLVTAK